MYRPLAVGVTVGVAKCVAAILLVHFSYTHVLQDGGQYTDLYEVLQSFTEMTQKLQGIYRIIVVLPIADPEGTIVQSIHLLGKP